MMTFVILHIVSSDPRLSAPLLLCWRNVPSLFRCLSPADSATATRHLRSRRAKRIQQGKRAVPRGVPCRQVGCRCHTSRATGFRIGSRLKTGVARVNAEMGDGRLLTEVMQHLRLRFSRKKASMYGTEHNVHDLNW